MKITLILIVTLFCTNLFSQNATHACSHNKLNSFKTSLSQSDRALSDMDKYDLKNLRLELNVTNLSRFISGKAINSVQVKVSVMNTFVFELHEDLTITEVKVNGTISSFTRTGSEISIISPNNHYDDDIVEVEVSYNGTPPAGAGFNSETGVFNDFSPTWGVQVTWTLSEPFSAYTWFPAKQVLTDKIESTTFIFTTEDHLKVGSNGLLNNTQFLANNKVRYIWQSNYPIDYYLVSFAVAPYQEYSYKILPQGATDSLLIQNYIYDDPQYLPNSEADILETGDMLMLLTDLYGEYPFINEKYGHCLAPLSGGMEHQTMTTQGFFVNWLTVHELGHQWWGDNVTCSSWGDIWINEGFASYSEYLYYQDQNQADADFDMLDRHNNIMSQPGGSVFVYDDTNSNRIFDGRLTYNKGAAVVHMIRNYIGDDALFFNALKTIQTDYKNSTMNTGELTQVFLQETGIDLTEFMNSWIYGESYPIYNGRYNTINDTIYIEVSQTSALNSSSQLYPSILELKLNFTDGSDMIIREDNTFENQGYYIPLNKEIASIEVDPNNWILNDDNGFVYDSNFRFDILNSILNVEDLDLEFTNPFNNTFNLNFKELNVESLNIVDITGSVVFSKSITDEKILIIDTKNWASSYYFLNVKSNGQVYNKLILKK